MWLEIKTKRKCMYININNKHIAIIKKHFLLGLSKRYKQNVPKKLQCVIKILIKTSHKNISNLKGFFLKEHMKSDSLGSTQIDICVMEEVMPLS